MHKVQVKEALQAIHPDAAPLGAYLSITCSQGDDGDFFDRVAICVQPKSQKLFLFLDNGHVYTSEMLSGTEAKLLPPGTQVTIEVK